MLIEEEKLVKISKKRKKGETKKLGAKISAPTLKLSQELSQLNQTELTQSTQKKMMMKFLSKWIKDKNLNSKLSSFFQTPNFEFKIFIPKFSVPHSQCPIY